MKISYRYLRYFSQEGNLKSDRLEHSISVYLTDYYVKVKSLNGSSLLCIYLQSVRLLK